MEAIIGIAIGIVIGAVLAWFYAKARMANSATDLRSEANLARERFADSVNAAEQARKEASEYQAQSTENKKEIATLQERVASLERDAKTADETNAELKADAENWRTQSTDNEKRAASLQTQLDAANKRVAEREADESKLADRFKVLATEVVDSNRDLFLSAADEKVGSIVKPLSDELKRIEKARNQSQGGLEQQIKALVGNNKSLEQTTRELKQALTTRSQTRGTWGEIQLKRVVELAGMTDHCDFQKQVTIPGETGRRSDRPDMVVDMPNGRSIVVDAKTPMKAYMESLDADSDAERKKALQKHARQVRDRARELTAKSYWSKLEQTPEFVVMFLPGEFLLQSALENDPDLFDQTVRNGVVIATPSTLIALLKTIELGWKEARLAQDAREIADLGKVLYDRLATYASHVFNVGKSLGAAVEHYNKSVRSFDTRLSVSARQLRELGVSTDKNVPEMKRIDEPVSQSHANLKAPNSNGRARGRSAARNGSRK